MKYMLNKMLWTSLKILSPLFLIIAIPVAIIAKRFNSKEAKDARLVWGPVPILNNSHWSRAMSDAGYNSQTYTINFFSSINQRGDWDRILIEEYKFIPLPFRVPIAFLLSLFRYDVFFLPFSGFLLGGTPLWRFESLLFKLAGKKTVLIPYGSDAYAYKDIRSTSLIHGLLMSYPLLARKNDVISRKVSYWRENADVVIPSWMGPDGIGRWDLLVVCALHVNTHDWIPRQKENDHDGITGTVYVTHAPNHRGFKGTEFILEAIKRIQKDGIKVELNLIEGKQNSEVKRILTEKTDILVDQLIVTGHGLNAVEGLTAGTVVISNLEDETYALPVRRWSYLEECPIVSATPENIEETLRILIASPKLRKTLGKSSREYAEKYHSYAAGQYMFGSVIDHLYGKDVSLINLYHPLLGEYHKTRPKVEHPLVKNKIPTR